jgi:hypothetical protein
LAQTRNRDFDLIALLKLERLYHDTGDADRQAVSPLETCVSYTSTIVYYPSRTLPVSRILRERRGLIHGRASEADVARSKLQRSYNLRAQHLDVGDHVVMNEHGQVYKLDGTTIHDDEQKIAARLAEIDAGQGMEAGTLRAWHQEQRHEQLTEQPPDPFIPLQAARAGIRKRGPDRRQCSGLGRGSVRYGRQRGARSRDIL